MKIKVDGCLNPADCVKCVSTCPAKIFVLKPVGTKKLSDYVKEWKISTIFEDLCNGCNSCVDICPNKCISIKF